MRHIANLKLETGMIILFILASILVAFSGWRSIETNKQYLEAEKKIIQINEQLRELDLALSSMQEAQNAQRGYLLTSNPAFLEPYEDNIRAFNFHITWLQQNMEDKERFKSHMDELLIRKNEKIRFMSHNIRLHDTADVNNAITRIREGYGKRLMDRIRALINDMVVTKSRDLENIKAASIQRAEVSRISTYFFGATICLFMVAAYLLLFYDLRERKRLQKRAEFLENHDQLTTLYNRIFFRELLVSHLKQAYHDGSRLAVLIVDLDNFKSINAQFGYAIGSAALIEVANRLAETARKEDAVARLRDDDFGIIVPHVHTIEELSIFAGRLITALTPPLVHELRNQLVGTSIGIALYPDDGDNAEQLLYCANSALEKTKLEGKSQYRFYSEVIDRAPAHTREEILTHALYRAITRQELSLYFQPQIDGATQKIVNMEALLRWNHPELGTISPEDFIPIAERTGLIYPIGVWVLRETCRRAQEWNCAACGWHVAINVSPLELINENFAYLVEETLAESGLPANKLEIEITERILMNKRASRELQKIKSLGVHISIDDFGTGYSSLSYLTRFSIDILKIDKSFIKNIPANWKDSGVVKTIINIGKELGITVTAEGIETREQAAFLRENGCDIWQGYLFFKPVPVSEVPTLLAKNMALA